MNTLKSTNLWTSVTKEERKYKWGGTLTMEGGKKQVMGRSKWGGKQEVSGSRKL